MSPTCFDRGSQFLGRRRSISITAPRDPFFFMSSRFAEFIENVDKDIDISSSGNEEKKSLSSRSRTRSGVTSPVTYLLHTSSNGGSLTFSTRSSRVLIRFCLVAVLKFPLQLMTLELSGLPMYSFTTLLVIYFASAFDGLPA